MFEAIKQMYTLDFGHGAIVSMSFSGSSMSYQQLVRTRSDQCAVWECESGSILSTSWGVACAPAAVAVDWAGAHMLLTSVKQ